jgi:hypothetical protein
MVKVLLGILKKETINNQKITDNASSPMETQQQQLPNNL